jgi:hypothetical protein
MGRHITCPVASHADDDLTHAFSAVGCLLPAKMRMSATGRRTKGQPRKRSPGIGSYAVSWTSHDCAYSTPFPRSTPDRLNADGLMPMSRTYSKVGGCLACRGIFESGSFAMRTCLRGSSSNHCSTRRSPERGFRGDEASQRQIALQDRTSVQYSFLRPARAGCWRARNRAEYGYRQAHHGASASRDDAPACGRPVADIKRLPDPQT